MDKSNKYIILKSLLFVVSLVAICAIICLYYQEFYNQKNSIEDANYFITKTDIKDNSPHLPMTITTNMNHNRGVMVFGEALNSYNNGYIIIEPIDSIAIYGWAINNQDNCPADEIYMEINNTFVKGVYGLPYPEIQQKYKISSSKVGFLFYFDRSLLINDDGKNCDKIKFYLIDYKKEAITSVAEYHLIYKNNKLKNIFRDITSTTWRNGLMLEHIENGSLDLENNVIYVNDGEIHISGWFVDIDNNKPGKNIHIAIGDNIYNPSYFYEREDVATVLNLTDAKNIGFKFTIHENLLKDNDEKLYEYIEFYLEDSNGTICKPIKYYLNKL